MLYNSEIVQDETGYYVLGGHSCYCLALFGGKGLVLRLDNHFGCPLRAIRKGYVAQDMVVTNTSVSPICS